MSTAYFVVLDTDEPNFDPFVDGKFLTKNLPAINGLATALGLKHFEDYACQDLSELGGPDMPLVWFEAAEGINWASAIAQRLKENPGAVKDVDAVIEDLNDYVRVFEEANKQGLKWHLELDF